MSDWRHRLHNYRDPGRLVRLLSWALAFEGLGAVTMVVVQLQLLSPAFGAVPIELSDFARVLGAAQIVHTAGWLTAGALYIAWVRRIVLNSRFLRAPAVIRSPWAGLWIFVPVAHIWMPFVVAADLWHSAHDVSGTRHVPRFSATKPRIPPLILAWWATRVGGGLWTCLGPAPLVTGRDLPFVMLLGAVLGLFGLLLQLLVARAITRQQQRQIAHDGLSAEEVPPLRAS